MSNAYRVRPGEMVDPLRVVQHELNAFADLHVHETAMDQSRLRHERTWEFYKRGYELIPVKQDRRRKTWRNWES